VIIKYICYKWQNQLTRPYAPNKEERNPAQLIVDKKKGFVPIYKCMKTRSYMEEKLTEVSI